MKVKTAPAAKECLTSTSSACEPAVAAAAGISSGLRNTHEHVNALGRRRQRRLRLCCGCVGRPPWEAMFRFASQALGPSTAVADL